MEETLHLVDARLEAMQTRLTMRLDGIEAMTATMSRRFDDLQAQININLQLCNQRAATTPMSTPMPPKSLERMRPYLSGTPSGQTTAPILELQDMEPQRDGKAPDDTVASATETEVEEPMDSCELTASIWDAVLLIFIEELGPYCSAFTVLALVLNMLLQGSFCMVVLHSFVQRSYTESTTEDYVHWRLNTAHQCVRLPTCPLICPSNCSVDHFNTVGKTGTRTSL